MLLLRSDLIVFKNGLVTLSAELVHTSSRGRLHVAVAARLSKADSLDLRSSCLFRLMHSKQLQLQSIVLILYFSDQSVLITHKAQVVIKQLLILLACFS